MMRQLLIMTAILLVSIEAFSQNYRSCEIYQCEYCNMQVLREHREGNCSKRTDGHDWHSWRFTGKYDSECNRQEQTTQNKLNELDKACQKNCPQVYQNMKVIECFCPETVPSIIEAKDGSVRKEFYRSGKLYLEDNRRTKTVIIYEQDGSFRKGSYIGDKWMPGKENGEWVNTKVLNTALGILPNFAQGYKVVFNNGQVVKKYDDEGNDLDLLETKKQEDIIHQAFLACQYSYQYQNFITNYPNSSYAQKAQEMMDYLDAKDTYLGKNWKYNDCSCGSISVKVPEGNVTSLSEYVRKYPNGVMVDSCKKMIVETSEDFLFKDVASIFRKKKYEKIYPNYYIGYSDYAWYEPYYTLLNNYMVKFPSGKYQNLATCLIEQENSYVEKNINSIYNEVNRLMQNNQRDQVQRICERILPFKSAIHDSYYYPLTLELAFIYWEAGEIDKTLAIIKENSKATIHYNNGDVLYSKKVKDYYRGYKGAFQLTNEKEVWGQIKAIIE